MRDRINPRLAPRTEMKIGMNLLLWTTHVTEAHCPILEKIKATGFDGVEIPILPNFRAMFDTFHANIEEENLPHAFA